MVFAPSNSLGHKRWAAVAVGPLFDPTDGGILHSIDYIINNEYNVGLIHA